jgi:hypothetical protein
MIESSDRLAWTQYRNGEHAHGSGLLSFNDKQPDKRQPAVPGFFADATKYANVDDIMKGK